MLDIRNLWDSRFIRTPASSESPVSEAEPSDSVSVPLDSSPSLAVAVVVSLPTTLVSVTVTLPDVLVTGPVRVEVMISLPVVMVVTMPPAPPSELEAPGVLAVSVLSPLPLLRVAVEIGEVTSEPSEVTVEMMVERVLLPSLPSPPVAVTVGLPVTSPPVPVVMMTPLPIVSEQDESQVYTGECSYQSRSRQHSGRH